ncbi:MAG: hypothetical protein C0168_02700 [Candidatus Aminicenantes bacterium]|nr:MAG: hypothetical protein C0168_02700 [Candidatus Aminicenantes bacterium]
MNGLPLLLRKKAKSDGQRKKELSEIEIEKKVARMSRRNRMKRQVKNSDLWQSLNQLASFSQNLSPVSIEERGEAPADRQIFYRLKRWLMSFLVKGFGGGRMFCYKHSKSVMRIFYFRHSWWPVALVFMILMLGGQELALGQSLLSPQFGFEYYGGTNKLRILNPWAGLRFSLGEKASFIVRYHYSDLRYQYYGGDGQGGTILKDKKAEISRISGTVYFSEKNLTGYFSGSYLSGSESYRGYILDSGLEWRFVQPASLIFSVYSIRERSVLWHPEEYVRWINTYSARCGVKLWLVKNLSFNPNIYFMRNSEKVKGVSYSVGLIYSPAWWMAVTVYYFRYGETAFYIFHGNYLSTGLNFYF